jgi:Lipase (class 3)
MATTAITPQGRMLCASVLTYSVSLSPSIQNEPMAASQLTEPYYAGAGYTAPPTMIQNGLGACTIGLNEDGIIVAFRGTVINSKADWFNDLLMFPKAGTNLPGKVHSGFYDNFLGIAPMIAEVLTTFCNENPTKPIFMTGHSKGAAMAPIAAYYMQANFEFLTSEVYLFAPPLPGTSEFSSAYNSLFGNTFSYQNNQDIVPLLPPSPTVAGELAAYFPKTDEKAAMLGFALLDYAPVGTFNTTSFIPAPIEGVYQLEAMNGAVQMQQLQAVEAALTDDDFKVFASAHSTACGLGYMSAICPEVCASATSFSEFGSEAKAKSGERR